METFVVGTAIAFVVVLFAAMAIAPMVFELTARPPAPFAEDQILSIEPVGLDRATLRVPTPIAAPGNAPFHREAA